MLEEAEQTHAKTADKMLMLSKLNEACNCCSPCLANALCDRVRGLTKFDCKCSASMLESRRGGVPT
eukprot:3256734-Amphidinium_carterae.1